MNLSESVVLALTSLRSNKMRALLTLLGVIIGIAAVIAILTLGNSLQAGTAKDLARIGANDFTIQVESRTVQEEEQNGYYGTTEVDPQSKLTPEIIEGIENRFRSQLDGVSIGNSSLYRGNVTAGEESAVTTVQPINTGFLKMKQTKLAAGRLLTDEDVDGDRQVAVVSPQVVSSLFRGDNRAALGSEIDFTAADGRATSFVIVGVYAEEEKSGGLIGDEGGSTVFVPWTSESRISEVDGAWDQISVRPVQGVDKGQFKQNLQAYMDEVYEGDSYFRAKVVDLQKEIAQLNSMLQTMNVAVSAIGGISLLVGGIGVMNIMLVTVTERTREIGIRKALGATRRAIRTQFVVESMIVGLIGGIIGVILGSVFGMIGANALGTFVYPPVGGVLVSLFFSLAIGLFFGYYPANKAAKLDPIDALRYE